MKPGVCHLEVYRGDTARWQFRLWADANKLDPTELEGATVSASIRAGSTLVPMPCTVTEPNIIDAVLEASAWSPPHGGYVATWDMQVTWPGGDVTTILAGRISVTGDMAT